MDFSLPQKCIDLRKEMKEFCAKEIGEKRERLESDLTFRKEIYKKMAKKGFFSLAVDKDCPLSYLEALIEANKFDAGIGVALSVSNWIAELITYYGTQEQKQKYLPKLASGEIVSGCFALTESDAGSDPKNISSTATETEDGFIIDGEKQWISNGNLAEICVVFAKVPNTSGHGISAFIVEAPNFEVTKIVDKLGLLTVNLTCLKFSNCKVPRENLIGEIGDGLKIALKMLDYGRLGITAQSIGIAEAAFEKSLKHAKTRKQFDHPIGQYQSIAFKIADMRVKIEAMKNLLYKANWLRETNQNFSEMASIAKLYASESVNEIAADAVQIHGGFGFIKEKPLERYYRDARITTIYEGTSEIQRIVIARHQLGNTFSGTN